MKNVFSKNQLMITALAIMIAIAGYLNFAGTKVKDEEVLSVNGEVQTDDMGNIAMLEGENDLAITSDISDEDLEQANGDIESLDTDVVVAGSGDVEEELLEALSAEEMDEVPGEAVFTSTTATTSALTGAKLNKEQMRAQNKQTLLEIINNANVSESQKQEAVSNMINMTDIVEKETAAEILLEARGFEDAIVSIDGENVDVVVCAAELTEAQRAQIEDIVIRKTGVTAESIIISAVSAN